MIWTIVTFYSSYKFFLILFGKFSFENSAKKNWEIILLPSYAMILIALIYDCIVVPFKTGSETWLIYFFLFFFFIIIFAILSIFDYFGSKAQLEISQKKSNSYPLHEEKKISVVGNQSTISIK